MNLNHFSNLKNRDSKNEKSIFNEIKKIKRTSLFLKKSSRDTR